MVKNSTSTHVYISLCI